MRPLFPTRTDHEVRERDYFFVVSFVVWGLWAGMGLWTLVKRERQARAGGRSGMAAPAAAVALASALALIPPVLNWRRGIAQHGADRTLAADFAYDLLNTVPPYGILFTYGDNDTFPLWWAQEVAGIRQDVTVVCLALAQTDWYMRQLRDNPVRDFDEAAAPAVWQGLHPVEADLAAAHHDGCGDAGRGELADPDRLHDVAPDRPDRGQASRRRRSSTRTTSSSLRIIQQNLGRRADRLVPHHRATATRDCATTWCSRRWDSGCRPSRPDSTAARDQPGRHRRTSRWTCR